MRHVECPHEITALLEKERKYIPAIGKASDGLVWCDDCKTWVGFEVDWAAFNRAHPSSPSRPDNLSIGTAKSDVGDAVECDLRIEIASDTPEKIEIFVKAVSDLILDAAGEHDCAVSIHNATKDRSGEPT